jgi:hypothetical protein
VTFSDQPRGRRARRDNGNQERGGYDNVPPEEREFPDLSPIRPRGGRHSAGNTGGQPQAPRESQQQYGGQQYGGQQPGGQPGTGQQYGGQQYGAGQYGERADGGQSYRDQTYADQSYGGQAYDGQQYGQALPQYAQAPPGGPRASAMPQPPMPRPEAQEGPGAQAGQPRGPRSGSYDWDDQEESNDPMAAFSERWHRRGQDTPADRRKRKRLYLIGGGVAAVAIAVGLYFGFGDSSGGAANSGVGNLITSFLPGELQQVPNACTVVPNSTLSQNLPGQLKMAEPPLNSGAQTECTWTLDNPPTYRVLEVYITAYSPNALVGNGSATFAATFAAAEDETSLQHPGPKSGQPAASVANVDNLGSSAFSSYQVFNETSNGAKTVTDIASVYVRYRNVVIQVVLNGLAQGTGHGKTYSGATRGPLQSTALAVAKQVTSSVTG